MCWCAVLRCVSTVLKHYLALHFRSKSSPSLFRGMHVHTRMYVIEFVCSNASAAKIQIRILAHYMQKLLRKSFELSLPVRPGNMPLNFPWQKTYRLISSPKKWQNIPAEKGCLPNSVIAAAVRGTGRGWACCRNFREVKWFTLLPVESHSYAF